MSRTGWSVTLVFAVVCCLGPRGARGDGISGRQTVLGKPGSSPRVALQVRDVRDEGKGRFSAEVVAHLGGWKGPALVPPAGGVAAKVKDPNTAYAVGKRYTFKGYTPPRARAGKWVIASRYWRVCEGGPVPRKRAKPPGKERIVLAMDKWLMELLCVSKETLRMASIMRSRHTVERYQKKESTQQLRRDIADPDLARVALEALHKRAKVRVSDLLRATAAKPKDTPGEPMVIYGRLLSGKGQLRFLHSLLKKMRGKDASLVADYLRGAFHESTARPLFAKALRLYASLELNTMPRTQRVCAQLWPIACKIEDKPSAAEKKAVRRLLAKRDSLASLRKHCIDTVKKLEKHR